MLEAKCQKCGIKTAFDKAMGEVAIAKSTYYTLSTVCYEHN